MTTRGFSARNRPRRLEAHVAEVLSAEDVANVAAALEPGSTAGVGEQAEGFLATVVSASI